MRRDDQWLADILGAGEAIDRFVWGMDLDGFMGSDRDQSAVIAKLIIIGEAANKLSPTLKARYDDVPWRSITGLRHMSVHEYFRVEWDRVWETANVDVPVLVAKVRAILKALDTSSPD